MATNFERSNMRLSMREKSLDRRKINKEHNSNFRAGYVHVYEEHLHKTGLRGRKRYLAYILLAILFLIVIANFIITIMILCVLQIDHTGMETLEFMPSGLLRFVYGGDMGSIHPIDSTIGSYVSQDLDLIGDTQAVIMQQKLSDNIRGASVSIDDNSIKVTARNMHVTNPLTGRNVFNTEYDDSFKVPSNVQVLNVRRTITSKVTGGTENSLKIEANSVLVRGNEGIHVDGKSVNLTANNDVLLSTYMDETMVLDGKNGIQLRLTDLPLVKGNSFLADAITTYKLCICLPSGKLFRVEVQPGERHACSRANNDVNPCSISTDT